MDNILCWNVRGLNAPNKQWEVILLCIRENTRLIVFFETKIKANKIGKVANTMFG